MKCRESNTKKQIIEIVLNLIKHKKPLINLYITNKSSLNLKHCSRLPHYCRSHRLPSLPIPCFEHVRHLFKTCPLLHRHHYWASARREFSPTLLTFFIVCQSKAILSRFVRLRTLSCCALVRSILKAHPYISARIDSPDTTHWVRKTAKYF